MVVYSRREQRCDPPVNVFHVPLWNPNRVLRECSSVQVARREGFTLGELIVALVVALVVTATTLSLARRQLRSYSALSSAVRDRDRLREGTAILVTDLRSLSASDTLPFASDTALELDASIGASTLCNAPAGNSISLPPDSLTSGALLTTWLVIPDADDEVMIFHDSSATTPTRGWQRFSVGTVTAGAASGICSARSGLTTAAEASFQAYIITVAPSVPVLGSRGSPVRLVRRGRYNVYRASDGEWYLGYRRCPAGVCTSVQPISGPYRAPRGTRAMEFRLYNVSGGTVIANGPVTRIGRIDIVMHTASDSGVVLSGQTGPVMRDSVAASVAVRN